MLEEVHKQEKNEIMRRKALGLFFGSVKDGYMHFTGPVQSSIFATMPKVKKPR